MIIDKTFHNIQCDHCGALIDEETWWDDKEALTTIILPECGWIECEGGRHYCEECWNRDDDDNIITKDGRKWDDDTHKEILTPEQRSHLNPIVAELQKLPFPLDLESLAPFNDNMSKGECYGKGMYDLAVEVKRMADNAKESKESHGFMHWGTILDQLIDNLNHLTHGILIQKIKK